MKQKYLLSRDEDKALIIKEYAELESGIFSLLCEEKFSKEAIDTAIGEGREALLGVLRTHNMYPPASFAEPLADAVLALFEEGEERKELLFDDFDFVTMEQEPPDSFENEEEGDDFVDDLLEEELEEDVYDEDDFKELDKKEGASIKLAEDEGGVDID